MSDKQYKLIRKQLRNVVQGILPEMLHNELVKAVQDEATNMINKRVEALSQNLTKALENIDQRSKDVQSYLIRNTTAIPAAAVEAAKSAESNE
jgi:hypothetical protein